AVTVAPTIGASPGSTTVPVIAAVTCWPHETGVIPQLSIKIARHIPILDIRCIVTSSTAFPSAQTVCLSIRLNHSYIAPQPELSYIAHAGRRIQEKLTCH